MFGLKFLKRRRRPAAPSAPPSAPLSAPPQRVSRLTGPPPPPPPGAFASFATPAAAAVPEPAFTPAAAAPDPFASPLTPQATSDHEPSFQAQDPVGGPPQPGEPAPARVRFFYEDGSVSEADPQESERLGYLATNLLEASRDDPA